MTQNSLAIECAEDLGLPSVRMEEGRSITFVRVQFADIGPKVNFATARLEFISPLPVSPTSPGTVSLGGEPSLITAHHLACERARIHAGAALATKRKHGALNHCSPIHRVRIAPV